MIDVQHITMLARIKGVNPERHAQTSPGFVQTSRAPWAESSLAGQEYTDEISVGFYSDQGGTSGEFMFQFGEFSSVNPGPKTWMRGRIYSDGWHALVCMPELLIALAERDGLDTLTPDQFVSLLLSLGYEDRTLRYL